MMEKVTLLPGVWTLIHASVAIQSASTQSGIRMHFGEEEPAVDNSAYFTIPEYDLRLFRLPQLGSDEGIYLMPDEDSTVEIVVY